MPVARVVGACFARGTDVLVPEFDLSVCAGGSADVRGASAQAAAVAARLCAGIVKPTRGHVYIGEFDARLQPAQAKRLVGFVPSRSPRVEQRTLAQETAFRADVWSVERAVACAIVADAMHALADDSAYARLIALALIAAPPFLVLESPPANLFARLRSARPDAALCRTFVGA